MQIRRVTRAARDYAHCDTDQQADAESEREHRSIQLNRVRSRKLRWTERHERAYANRGRQQPQAPAEQCEQHAFREQLSNQAAAAGAERRAHRELAPALRPASKQAGS